MKNIFAYIGFASLALLSSCSSDIEEDLYVNPATVKVESSDVEIRLSTGTVSTRASIESDEAGLFEAEDIGVFCLARRSLPINNKELQIKWDRSDPNDHWSIWMDNVKANAQINADETATDLVWAEENKVYWYPTGNWHSYSFYAYHPYQETVEIEDELVKANFELDGTQDVIWGYAKNLDNKYAYSAKYFRDNTENEHPNIAFGHKFMRFTFSIEAGKDATGQTSESALQMGIKSLELLNVPSSATLCIADRKKDAATDGYTSPEGTITADWENNLINYVLMDPEDQPLAELDAENGTGYWASAEETTLGQGFLVPVPDVQPHQFQIRAVLQNKAGQVFDKTEYPMDIVLTGASVYKAGRSYNVKIIVNGPEEVKIKATLKPWHTEPGTSMEDVIF